MIDYPKVFNMALDIDDVLLNFNPICIEFIKDYVLEKFNKNINLENIIFSKENPYYIHEIVYDGVVLLNGSEINNLIYSEDLFWEKYNDRITYKKNSLSELQEIHEIYNFDKNNPLTLITARTSNLKKYTLESLKNNCNNNIEFDIIYAGHSKNKKKLIYPEIKYFIEDNYQTALELSEKIEFVFLYDCKWNRFDDSLLPFNVFRVKSIEEAFCKWVEIEKNRTFHIGYV